MVSIEGFAPKNDSLHLHLVLHFKRQLSFEKNPKWISKMMCHTMTNKIKVLKY